MTDRREKRLAARIQARIAGASKLARVQIQEVPELDPPLLERDLNDPAVSEAASREIWARYEAAGYGELFKKPPLKGRKAIAHALGISERALTNTVAADEYSGFILKVLPGKKWTLEWRDVPAVLTGVAKSHSATHKAAAKRRARTK